MEEFIFHINLWSHHHPTKPYNPNNQKQRDKDRKFFMLCLMTETFHTGIRPQCSSNHRKQYQRRFWSTPLRIFRFPFVYAVSGKGDNIDDR